MNLPNLQFVDNDAFGETGELWSLKLALDSLRTLDSAPFIEAEGGPSNFPGAGGAKGVKKAKGAENDLIVSYGDVLFRKYILQILLDSDAEYTIVVDVNWQESRNRGRFADYVQCTEPFSRLSFGKPVYLLHMSPHLSPEEIHGEWMGFLRVRGSKVQEFHTRLDRLVCEEGGRQLRMHDLLNHLASEGEEVRVLYTTGNWMDIDSIEDLVLAARFV